MAQAASMVTTLNTTKQPTGWGCCSCWLKSGQQGLQGCDRHTTIYETGTVKATEEFCTARRYSNLQDEDLQIWPRSVTICWNLGFRLGRRSCGICLLRGELASLPPENAQLLAEVTGGGPGQKSCNRNWTICVELQAQAHNEQNAGGGHVRQGEGQQTEE